MDLKLKIEKVFKNLKELNENATLLEETSDTISFLKDDICFTVTIKNDLLMFVITDMFNKKLTYINAVSLKLYDNNDRINEITKAISFMFSEACRNKITLINNVKEQKKNK